MRCTQGCLKTRYQILMSKQPLQAALMKHSLILLNVLDLYNWHDRVSPKQQLEGWRGPAEQTPVCSRHLSEEQYFREAWGSGGVESESGTRETGTVSGTSGGTKDWGVSGNTGQVPILPISKCLESHCLPVLPQAQPRGSKI